MERSKGRFPALAALLGPRFAILRKAGSFALIGVVNAVIDAALFFLAYAWLLQPGPVRALSGLSDLCQCGSPRVFALILANIFGWFVAVSSSYVMNSYITFAAESGRQLSLRLWAKFVASGVLGVTANTVVLVMAAQFVPVWLAKGLAIFVGFLVNFSMSHFVVFRRAPEMPKRGR
jgi:putative flippase GtrA